MRGGNDPFEECRRGAVVSSWFGVGDSVVSFVGVSMVGMATPLSRVWKYVVIGGGAGAGLLHFLRMIPFLGVPVGRPSPMLLFV